MLILKTLLFTILIPKQFNFSVGFLALSPFRAFLIALLPFVLFSLFTKRKFKWEAVDTFALLISIWPLFSLFLTSGVSSSIESGGIFFLEIFIPYFLTRQTITSYTKLLTFSKFSFFLIAILALLAIPEVFAGKYLAHSFLDSIFNTTSIQFSGKRLGLWRATSLTDHSIILGTTCSIGFILSLSLISRHKKYLLYTCISLFGVFSSLSSGPLLASMSQLGLFTWSRIMKVNKNKWLILIILVAVLYILIDIASNRTPLKVMFSYLLFSPHNGYVRYYMWVNSIFLVNYSWFSFFFGYGIGSIPYDLIQNGFYSRLMSISVDSFWLVNLLRYGWVMFSLWAFLIFNSIQKNRQEYKKNRHSTSKSQKAFSEAWMILVISFTIISFTVDLWGGMKSIFIILIACSCSRIKRTNSSEKGVIND